MKRPKGRSRFRRSIQWAKDLRLDSPYHFCFTLAPTQTNAVLTIMAHEKFRNFKVGDRVEVSPDAYAVTNQIARRIKTDGGSALLVDYGRDYTAGESPRVNC